MRDTHFEPSSFCLQLERSFQEVPKLVENLRRAVVDNPNSLREGQTFYFSNRAKTLREIIILSIVQWWMPKEVQCLLYLDLQRKVEKLNFEDQTLVSQFLISKERTKLFLLETKVWHTRDFFGNLLKDVDKLLSSLKIYYKGRKKVKYPQRKRGYHDHGSRVPNELWKPKEDYTLTEEQWRIECERQTFKDTLAFIEGLII